MKGKKIVVAIGRNAFGTNLPEQQKGVAAAASAIVDLVEAKYQVVLTHSNGPQVGMIHTAMNEFAKNHSQDGFTASPMSVCSAMSQGFMGFDLQNAIRTELLNRGIYKPVCTIITQVKVDPFDAAFNHPMKTIGRILTKEEADAEVAKGNYVTEKGEGYQRIIASPTPIEIYEIDSIKALSDAGQIVIAGGGGGIPVLEQGTRLKGASAVIEKDATAAKLAHELDADALLILTATDCLLLHEKTEQEQPLSHVSVAEGLQILEEGGLSQSGGMPKLAAGIHFVTSGTDRKAYITSLPNALKAVQGKIGTVIE